MKHTSIAAVWILLASACATGAPSPAATALASRPAETPIERRVFAPVADGEPSLAGISYGPFREGQSPSGPYPSRDQILEDLEIIAQRWHLIRVYSSQRVTEKILQVIRDNDIPVRVMLGIWIGNEAPESELEVEVAEAIRLANSYPDQVAAVNVGNEAMVSWSAHRVPKEVVLEQIRKVRPAIQQPVTVADDYNFWNKPEAREVAAELDFLVVHAYAMWNGKSLDEAVPWTASVMKDIQSRYPDMPLVIGETGWATGLNEEGSEREHIKADAGTAEQARFYREFTAWAAEAQVPYFYFEAFDEPWKGSDDPREVEKHWGLYYVDRTPKPVLQ